MTEQPTSMLLRAKFDIDQVGYNMEWHFSRTDQHGNPIVGKDAGSVYFTVGETFFIHVSSSGKARKDGSDPLGSFKILDCVVISTPQLSDYGPGRPTRFSPPSPFVSTEGDIPKYATIPLDPAKFVSWIGGKPVPGYYEQTQAWSEHLTVGQIPGRWELSFIVTVEIVAPDGSSTRRVFGFDPEGSVGTGINPN